MSEIGFSEKPPKLHPPQPSISENSARINEKAEILRELEDSTDEMIQYASQDGDFRLPFLVDESKPETIGNTIMDNFMDTVTDVYIKATEQLANPEVQFGTHRFKEYEKIARSMIPLAYVTKGLCDGSLMIRKTPQKPNNLSVHTYKIPPFQVQNERFSGGNIFIRTDKDSSSGKTIPPKMVFEIFPYSGTLAHDSISSIHARFDQENSGNLSYDLEVNKALNPTDNATYKWYIEKVRRTKNGDAPRDQNGRIVINYMDLANGLNPNAHSHHLPSKIRNNSFTENGISYGDVLRKFVDKFNANSLRAIK